jgi:hypothetical protein
LFQKVCPKRFWDSTSDIFHDDMLRSDGGLVSPPAKLGEDASFVATQLVASTQSGFGEFRNFLPWSLKSMDAFAAGRPGHEAMPATFNDTGSDRSVAQLRSDTRRAYRGCVAFVDYEFGRVMDALSRSGQAEQTVVAVFADHGWKLGEFDLWGKHTVLHADVHVPLMIRHPHMQVPRATSHAVVELVDLFPTLVDLAMGPDSNTSQSLDGGRPALPRNLDGMSLAGLVVGDLRAHAESELLPPGAKVVAVAQFMPFVKNKRCMAYTVIGKVYAMKRWTGHPSMFKYAKVLRNKYQASVDLHMIPFERQLGGVYYNAIPFALEASRNLANDKKQDPYANTSKTEAEAFTAVFGRRSGGRLQYRHRAVAVRETMDDVLLWARRGAEASERAAKELAMVDSPPAECTECAGQKVVVVSAMTAALVAAAWRQWLGRWWYRLTN